MIYWLTGQPGAGKTTLLKYLIKSLTKTGNNPFLILNDFENARLVLTRFERVWI